MIDFRDRLKAAQHVTPEYREKFERSMKSMIERKLTPAQRAGSIFVALFNLVGISVMTWVIIHFHLSSMFATAFTILAAVVLVMTLIRAKEAITGKAEQRNHPRVIAWIGWFGAIFYMIAMMMAQPSMGKGFSEYFTVLTLFPLIVMAAQLIQMTIGQSELVIREKMLEMELRLAEINDKLDRQTK